jgi:hypothetical protein
MFAYSSHPLWLGLALGFILSVIVVQILALKTYAALLWLPILLVCLVLVMPVAFFVLPARMVRLGPSGKNPGSYRRTLVLFLTLWFSLIVFAVVYGFFTGWLAALLGARRQDVSEVTDLWSMPLGFINSSFVIRPDRGLAEVLGIVTANCYFDALILTVVFKVVHGFIRRSRVTQLGISTTTLDDDDEL